MCAAAAVVQSPMRSFAYIGQVPTPLVSSNASGGDGSRALSTYWASERVAHVGANGELPEHLRRDLSGCHARPPR